jgi:hypothetical protein
LGLEWDLLEPFRLDEELVGESVPGSVEEKDEESVELPDVELD